MNQKRSKIFSNMLPVAGVIIILSFVIGLFSLSGLEKLGNRMQEASTTSFRESLINAPNSWVWFLIGGMTALVGLILWNWRNSQ